MATFPTLIPSSRTFTPGRYPHSEIPTLSGLQTRVRTSNVLLDQRLRLSFIGLTQSQMLSIRNHYADQQGRFLSFAIPNSLFSGMTTPADFTPAGYSWIYAGAPKVEDIPCAQRYNVSVELLTIPPEGANINGAELSINTTIAAGQATGFVSGFNLTISSSIETNIVADNGSAGFDLTVGASITILTPQTVETGTQAPLLGAGGAVDFTGWTRIQNATNDDANIEVTGWPFTFTIAGTGYTSAFVGSNTYITFGSGSDIYQSFSATVPAFPKIHFGADDNSYQRIYTKSDVTAKNNKVMRIRYEGAGATTGTPGSPGIVAEFAFFEPALDGSQLIELRIGNHNRTSGQFMIASASTSYASDTISANTSWVFAGNATGTSWTLTSNRYVG